MDKPLIIVLCTITSVTMLLAGSSLHHQTDTDNQVVNITDINITEIFQYNAISAQCTGIFGNATVKYNGKIKRDNDCIYANLYDSTGTLLGRVNDIVYYQEGEEGGDIVKLNKPYEDGIINFGIKLLDPKWDGKTISAISIYYNNDSKNAEITNITSFTAKYTKYTGGV